MIIWYIMWILSKPTVQKAKIWIINKLRQTFKFIGIVLLSLFLTRPTNLLFLCTINCLPYVIMTIHNNSKLFDYSEQSRHYIWRLSIPLKMFPIVLRIHAFVINEICDLRWKVFNQYDRQLPYFCPQNTEGTSVNLCFS